MFRLVAVALVAACAYAPAADSKLLEILKAELDRNFKVLKEKGDPPAYYIAYAVTESESESASASLGAITSEQRKSRIRTLDVTVRVGNPKLDNYHSLRGDFPQFTSGAAIAIDDNPNAIRRRLWAETDRVYKLAAQRLINIRTNKEVRVADKESSDDFSAEQPNEFAHEAPSLDFDRKDWYKRIAKVSREFAKFPEIIASHTGVQAVRETKYFVNSEGASIMQGQNGARITISAAAKAEDGMDLQTFDSFNASDPKHLPKERDLREALSHVAKDAVGLRKAPLVEPYVGPAILSGRAAGVFFHEIFGHRVEGHRLKDESDGQTFAKSVGQSVLPDFLSVVFDPTLKQAAGEDLNGWFEFDDEGVKARKVTVVEKGVLKTFLMSRTPIPGFSNSNGHGRRQAGAEVVSRQSNLLVQAARTVPESELEKMLIEEVKKQNKPYGFYLQEITGGFTNTSRRGIQAFKVIPLVVYRIYPDGKKELVRGADLVGTPLASFAKIIAAGDKLDVFNGFCGAESGSVPVSAVSPALLVSEIEIQKKESSRERPPLLPAPPIKQSESGGGL
ncbi:MAG: TldD/PmbA family protein [Bryobacteraceae bacterium]